MDIESSGKVRIKFMETFFDVFPRGSYCAELQFYSGLSYFALLQNKKFDKEFMMFVCPDKAWFDEWLEENKNWKIILQEGKEG